MNETKYSSHLYDRHWSTVNIAIDAVSSIVWKALIISNLFASAGPSIEPGSFVTPHASRRPPAARASVGAAWRGAAFVSKQARAVVAAAPGLLSLSRYKYFSLSFSRSLVPADVRSAAKPKTRKELILFIFIKCGGHRCKSWSSSG